MATPLEALLTHLDAPTATAETVEPLAEPVRKALPALKATLAPKRLAVTLPLAAEVLQVLHAADGEAATKVARATGRELWACVDRQKLKQGVRFSEALPMALTFARAGVETWDVSGPKLAAGPTFKVAGAKDAALTSPTTLRALLEDGRLVELTAGQKKPRDVAQLSLSELDTLEGAVVTATHWAACVYRLDDAGDSRASRLVVDGRELPAPAGLTVVTMGFLDERCWVSVLDVEGRAGFGWVEGDAMTLRWLPPVPSGGSAPPAPLQVSRVVRFEGKPVGWFDRGRWFWLDDGSRCQGLTAFPELASTFEDCWWGSDGARLRGGVLTRPVWLEGLEHAIKQLSPTALVATTADERTLWLGRFERVA